MLTFFGIIFILAGVALFIAPNAIKAARPGEENFITKIPHFAKVGIIVLGVLLMTLTSLFFYAEPGYSYLVQYATGQQVSVLSAGPKLKLFGRVLPFKKVMTVRFANFNENEVSKNVGSVEVRFNDAVTASVEAVVRFRLPTDAEHFKKLALDFREQENLVGSSLIPVSREAIRNSGRMISAQEYIVGKGGEFENAVLDQLQNGIYMLETIEIKSSTNSSEIREASERVIQGKETVRYMVQIRKDKEGNIVRKEHPFNEYNIVVSQASVQNVDPEQKFKDMIGQQRDAAAEANIERQKAKKAEYEKQRIIAEGEAEKAKKKVEKEKEQVEILIAAETERKKQEELVKTRRLELTAKQLEAQGIKALADAESYKRQKIMAADGALSVKLDALVKINQAYADSIKGTRVVPDVVIGGTEEGGQNSSAMQLIQMLLAQTARDLKIDTK